MNVTQKQKEKLLESTQEYPEVARGRIRSGGQSRKEMILIFHFDIACLNCKWDNIASNLNKLGEGPMKTSKEWKKTWKDWQSYVLKKETKRKNHMQGTGGGPPEKLVLSTLDEKLLTFLTPEAVGLLNVPEGGFPQVEEPLCDTPEEGEAPPQFYNEQLIDEDYKQMFPDIVDYLENDKENEPTIIDDYQTIEDNNASAKLEKQISFHNKEKKWNKKIEGNSQYVKRRKTSRNDINSVMIQIQKEQLQLKKEKIQLMKNHLNVKVKILHELQEIKSLIQEYTNINT